MVERKRLEGIAEEMSRLRELGSRRGFIDGVGRDVLLLERFVQEVREEAMRAADAARAELDETRAKLVIGRLEAARVNLSHAEWELRAFNEIDPLEFLRAPVHSSPEEQVFPRPVPRPRRPSR